MMSGHKNAYDCIKAFSETDFTEDLKKFDVPTLIIHGDDDQIVPIGASAMLSAKLVKDATLKIYPGGSHASATRARISSTRICSRSARRERAGVAPSDALPAVAVARPVDRAAPSRDGAPRTARGLRSRCRATKRTMAS